MGVTKLKYLITFICIYLFVLNANSQIVEGTFYIPNYPIPELYYTDSAPELPDNVWNHKLKYFPDSLYNQIDLPNCGQASGIYYCMTYMFNKAHNRDADSTNIFDPNFTFNFLNGGDGDYGVSTFDAWNIIKSQGNPSLETFNTQPYPGYFANNNFRGIEWMNGYENYLKSMSNRIKDYYSLNLSSDEDLVILKHSLNNGFSLGDKGNIAIFYCDNSFFYGAENYHIYYDTLLTSPQISTKVYTSFHEGSEHSMTVVGYTKNEQIDFNNDGIISDTIDINNDGIIDHHDNETCLWIIANSVGREWSRDIFLLKYDMICSVWNSQIFFPISETNYQPELTFKIELEHLNRRSLKISAGYSSNPDADYPEYILDFPIFNFQGGPHLLSGVDTLQSPERLEFGIDISDIKKKAQHSGEGKIFLIIDNSGVDDCKLLNASIIDYSNETPKEIQICSNEEIIPSLSTRDFSANIEIDSEWDNNNISILNKDAHVVLTLSENQTEAKLIASGGNGLYSFEIFDTCEYKQELTTDEYNFILNSNYSDSDRTIINPSTPISFAGKQFNSITIQGVSTIFLVEERVTNPYLYPYQMSPVSYFEDLQIELFAGNQRLQNHRSYYEETDESFKLWLKSYMIFSIEFFYNGVIQITYQIPNYQPTYNSGIISNSKKYFFNTPDPDYNNGKNSIIFTPQYRNTYFSISNTGVISCSPDTPLGEHELKVIINDSEGKKLFKDIKLSVIDDNIIGKLYPNPTSDNIYYEINTFEQQNAIIEIYNITGQLIYGNKRVVSAGISSFEFAVKQFEQGVYLLRVSIGRKSQTQRFVVTK